MESVPGGDTKKGSCRFPAVRIMGRVIIPAKAIQEMIDSAVDSPRGFEPASSSVLTDL
jgi:hypothetical protein